MKRRSRIALTICVSAGFLFLAVRGTQWSQVWEAIVQTSWGFVLAIFVTTIWTLYIRAQRWQVLLLGLRRVERTPLVHATNIGFMANMVLPLRAGEIIRPVLLSRRANLPLGGVLASIVLERIFDLLTVILLFGISILLVPVSPVLRNAGWLLVFVAASLCGVIAIARWHEARVWSLWKATAPYLPRVLASAVEEFVSGFLQSVRVLDRPGAFTSLTLWTIYLWVVIASANALGILALGLPVPLFHSALVVTAFVALAVSAPSAPGYVGAFQFGCTLALGLFEVAQSAALAFSLVLHATQFAATLVAGVYSLTSQGLSFRQIEQVSESRVTVS